MTGASIITIRQMSGWNCYCPIARRRDKYAAICARLIFMDLYAKAAPAKKLSYQYLPEHHQWL